ncbi:hypothetical protein C5F51_36210 [Nocardia nova]|uniref:Uncharacterized protein n=1 Tax=Nocardia nova TaxID=37330 RepID=A0A2S5ZUV0_9NOCA|nr:hypothetical protein C5F51_36210 [Nocardia nova]
MFAVFASSNQAGTAALFVAAAAFLLMGVQGTPLAKFGSGDKAMVFRERRRIQKQLLQRAATEDTPEGAEAYVNAAEIAAPSPVMTGADWVPLPAATYEGAVRAALERLVGRTEGWTVESEVPIGNRRIDFVVRAPNGTAIGIEVRNFSRAGLEAQVAQSIVDAASVPDANLTAGLVVMPRVSGMAAERIHRLFESSDSLRGGEAVQWTGPQDDYLLAMMLGTLTGQVIVWRG